MYNLAADSTCFLSEGMVRLLEKLGLTPWQVESVEGEEVFEWVVDGEIGIIEHRGIHFSTVAYISFGFARNLGTVFCVEKNGFIRHFLQ